MPKTKILWHYIVDYDWDTKQFKMLIYKEKFFIDPERPNIYFYDRYLDDGIYKDEVGKVRNLHVYTYHLHSPKLTKSEVECAFRDYFWEVINRTEREQKELMLLVEDTIRKQLKDDY